MQFNAYTISLLAAAAISAGGALFAWRRRSVTAGAELALLTSAVAIWSFFQALEGGATTRFAKMFWATVLYPANMSIPLLFLLFALRYTQMDRLLTKRRMIWLSVIPFVSVVMAATSGVQHLLWSQVTLTNTRVGIIAVYAHGPWFWVEIVYSYSLMLFGIVVLAQTAMQMPRPYSSQAGLILFATAVPLSAHLVYTFSPASMAGIDITPIAFTASATLVALALFGYRMLDLRPIARRVLYESIRDAMIATDVTNRVVDMNQPASEIIGLPVSDVIGKLAAKVFSGLPELVGRIENGELESHEEITIDNKGASRDYDLLVWPLRDGRSRILGKLITLHDVTQTRLAQEELERINAELDGYAHTVSHDLKGPLTSIMLANQALERLLATPETAVRNEKIENILGLMLGSTEKANAHINCLLALAEAGQKPTTVKEVDVGGIVSSVLEEHRGDVEDHRVRVDVGDLGTIRADPTHIYQLFANLIGNAFRHNAGLDLKLEVRRLGAPDGVPRFLVRDNGQGFNVDDLERVFEPFYKAGSAGTGIGLATARRIVNVYGGDIQAYNDHGACLEFSLCDWPLEADSAGSASTPSS